MFGVFSLFMLFDEWVKMNKECKFGLMKMVDDYMVFCFDFSGKVILGVM